MSPHAQTGGLEGFGFQDVYVLDTHVDDNFREAHVFAGEPEPVDDEPTRGGAGDNTARQQENERERQRAHLLQEEAERSLAAATEEAFARGWEEGQKAMAPKLEAEIRAKVAAEADAAIEQSRRQIEEKMLAERDRASLTLHEAARALSVAREKMQESYAADVARVALGVAKEVIMKELATEPAMIEASVRHCLQRSHGHEIFQVRVHPKDLEIVRQAFGVGENAQLKFVADDTIEPGGCIVDTDLGSVDGQLETRWNRVVSVFEESFRG